MTDARESGDRFEIHLAQINLSGARLGYLLSAVLMPAGFTLDLAMAPAHVWEFFWIRVAAGLVALALLGVTYLRAAQRHPVLLGAGPPLVCASGIEAMILRLDGVVSPYYAGLNLCILAVGVLYTWRWRHALAVSGAIVALWLLPAVPQALRGELLVRPFFNNVYFLTLTTVISVASTVIRFRAAEREFRARSDLEQTSAELAETLEQLQELSRMKNEFFANISHELRTPLTLILSPVEDLLGRAPPEAERSALLVVRRNAQRLLRLIDDLLDLARLEAGGLRLHVAEIDAHDLARRVVEAAAPTAEKRELELTLHGDERTDGLFGDPHRIEVVLTNLVSNALKFTPAGGHVQVHVRDDAEQATVEVRDDGPGIDPKDQERIFERFYQVEGSERRRHGGAGIGLSLARELARLHGGDLTADSTPGRGSVFRLSLPKGRGHVKSESMERRRVKLEHHPARRESDRTSNAELVPLRERGALHASDGPPIRLERGRRARILVAEDEADLRAFIVGALAREFDVSEAEDGEQALTLVQSSRPDLVLTDVMMPNVSGTDLCRAIKQSATLRATPVILLTARSGDEATLEGYSAGADDFVPKPFHTRVLVARIRAQLRLRALGLQLADQARLSTAGTLAAGIAHEVKNPVNAILNAARVLQKPTLGKVSSEKLLRVICEGATRVSDIVSVLEEHVRPAEDGELTSCNVEHGIEATLRLLEYRMKGVRVHRDYSAKRPVIASARQLNQVFLNLLDNAVRAEPKNVWVRTEDTPSGVSVSVADDGSGIDAEVVPLIFEPFFTTRSAGEGTGLGLYLCRRIVDDCGGTVRYQSRDGGGAQFVIDLPALEVAA